ncbi:hypothetical protein LSAT2_008306, partial [Lamellibrachia satsuma]
SQTWPGGGVAQSNMTGWRSGTVRHGRVAEWHSQTWPGGGVTQSNMTGWRSGTVRHGRVAE